MAFAPADAFANARAALVLAAEEYSALQRSAVGIKPAEAIAAALTARGFDVIVAKNPTNAQSRAKLKEFADKARGADAAIVVLIGHGAATNGQTFFLPANTELTRATDLFSRGIAIGTVMQVAGTAREGGVVFLMTTPRFETLMEGLDARPVPPAGLADNVFAAFSASNRLPVSGYDAAAEAAAEAMVAQLKQPAVTFGEMAAAARGQGGLLAGVPPEGQLEAPAPAPEPVAEPEADPAKAKAAAAAAAEAQARAAEAEEQQKAAAQKLADERKANEQQLQAEQTASAEKIAAERKARQLAEQQLQEEQVKAEQAQARVAQAQAEAAKAQAEARKAQAEAERALADAEVAKQQAEQARLATEKARATGVASATPADADSVVAEADPDPAAIEAAEAAEGNLGESERRRMQRRLRNLGLYTGPIDGRLGVLTREAIMGFQRTRKEDVTGFLTPEQYRSLLPAKQ